MRKALAVARKEFLQIVRDGRTLVILLVVPIFFLLLFGYALNWDIRHVSLAVDDRDRTPESRAIIDAFVHSGYFDLVASASDEGIEALMNTNQVRAVLVVPPDLGRDLRRGRRVPVQVLINGDNSNTATVVMSYAVTILQNESAKYAGAMMVAPPPVTVEPRVWYNSE